MLQKIRALAAEYDMLPAGSTVLCAVSGGADSICLLHILLEMGRTQGFSVAAAHLNHQLRGEAAERDATFVENRCNMWKTPCVVERADVVGEAARRGKGVEETARILRYDFLRRAAEQTGAVRIATAHSADDNAETLLLHLIRGSGLQGLTGIPPRRGAVVRPMLTVTRAEILDYLSARSISYVEDVSNRDDSYTRNWVRHQVMPLLRTHNPKLTQSLSRTIQSLRNDNDYLNAQAALSCRAARRSAGGLAIQARSIAQLPSALAPRTVRLLLKAMEGGEDSCSSAHLNAVVQLCREGGPSAAVSLPNGKRAQRVYEDLLLTNQPSPQTFSPVLLNRNGETLLKGSGWRLLCRSAVCPASQSSPDHFYLSAEKCGETIVVRPRQIGDALRLPLRPGRKSIKKLMIDSKLPRHSRDLIPVLADEKGILAAAGFGPEADRLAQAGEPAYEIRMIPPNGQGT